MPARAVLLSLLITCAAAASVAAQLVLPPKHVAAPPEELLTGALSLPDPAASAVPSRSAWLPARWSADGRVTLHVPVEADGRLRVLPVFDAPGAVRVRVAEPGGAPRTLDAWLADGDASARDGPLAPGLPHVTAREHLLRTSRRGQWTIELERLASAGRDGAAPPPRGGVFVAHDHTALRLVTRLAHWELTTRGRPALLAHVARAGAPSQPLVDAPFVAELELRDAAGATTLLRLHDDGAHADGAPGDGVAGAWLPVDVPGELELRVVARGTSADGPFLRTRQLRLPLHAADLQLTGGVHARLLDGRRLELAAELAGAPDERPWQVAAEVWGVTPDGTAVPVAWLGGMTSSAAGARAHGAASLPLVLDLRWLGRAGVSGPLELRALRVQHPGTHVPVARAERLAVPPVRLPAASLVPPPAVDAAMLTGVPDLRLRALSGPATGGAPGASAGPPGPTFGPTQPQAPAARQPDALAPQPEPLRALMLVHGYCSSLVWDPDDFSGELIVFADPDANRSHDAFAQLVAAAGLGVDSFGVVAHSQGGAAALHLLTYYRSGLDDATGPRRIQSVGTPYQGTPLGGDLAILGEIFGQGCGTNSDLSVDGAALWLAGIPAWARAEVHHYTTSTGGFWCNFLTNFVLTNPEDGVVERFRGQLPGGNDEGHVTGWCHTTGMNDPAQYTDAARNAEMDALAAR